MNRLSLVVSIVALALVPFADRAPGAEGTPLHVPGVFSIDSPGPGYHWTEIQSLDIRGVPGRVYACTRDGATGRAVLTLMRRPAEQGNARSAALKAHYNGLVETLVKAGIKNLRGTPPSVVPPIPERVRYAISGTDAKGRTVHVNGASVFGRNVYSLQVLAYSREELAALTKIVETLKEETP